MTIRKTLAVKLAVTGLAFYTFGLAAAMIAYNRQHPRGYSPLNHFVSELSSPTLSSVAWVLNISLTVGSLLLAPLLLCLGNHIRTKLGYAGVIVGFCAIFGVAGVGFAPMEMIFIHLFFAMSFFGFWLLTILLFTIAFWRRFSFRESPFILLTGLVTLGVTGSFVGLLILASIFLLPSHLDLQAACNDFLKHSDSFARPTAWSVAVLEWSVLLSVYAWVLAISRYLLQLSKSD